MRKWLSSLRLGVRYETTTSAWIWKLEYYEKDVEMRNKGENRNARMVRLLMPLINSINRDLVFTAEIPEDFATGRLPTLDFEL